MSARSVREVGVAHEVGELQGATSAASSIQELISTIPTSYKIPLGDQLTKKYRLSHKLANCQSTLTSYQRHKAEDSLPPLVRNSLKEPKLQFAKEWLADSNGSGSPVSFSNAVRQARQVVLDQAIALKQKEADYLATLTMPDTTAWSEAVVNVATRVAKDLGGRLETSGTTHRMVGVPDAASQELAAMVNSCTTYTYRCLALARAAIDRNDLQKMSKLTLKQETDAIMIDADAAPNASVSKIIDERISSLEKKLLQAQSQSAPAEKRRKLTHDRRTEEVLPQARRPSQGTREWHSEAEREEGREQKEAGRSSMKVDTFLAHCSREFRPWRAEEYPDVYLEMNVEDRVKIAVALSACWHVDSLRFSKPGVFLYPDVSLPEDVQYLLAVNHKYILHSRPDPHEVASARDRFQRSVRLRWHFRNQPPNKDYIPKFHVPNPLWQPPAASAAIESGIEDAMKEIDSQLGQGLSRVASDPPRHGNMAWKQVQEVLSSKRLIVKLTDKNLGLAVFPKDWYKHACMKMLGDLSSYRMAKDLDVEQVFLQLMEQLEKWKLPSNMENFIRERTQKELPVFHAIPKVHKKPWALRPIVPSHSWVTSRLSEVIDHLCRPLLDKLPWVVDSTKRVLQKLEKVKTNSEKCWIVTGDVVAFYTNIQSTECADIVAGAWARYESGSRIRPRVIKRMVEFVMDHNYFQFLDQSWKQLNGLAMGTSCAPVLANTYAGFYERQLGLISHKGVRLYVRYIDDILLIFNGTEKELTDYLSKVQLGTLTVNWDYSRVKKEFLDIEIMNFRTVLGWSLATRLFTKPMNRFLYIPWSSAHPSHVKKAFVKAELIRFAMVSSEVGFFAEARMFFYGNLRRRGYPAETLDKWFRQVSYDSRAIYLADRKVDEEFAPLMLSGHYNPVWEYINPDDVLRKAMRSWSLERELPETLRGPLIRSLGRGRNLGDLLSAWNKTILHTSLVATETVET